MGRCMPSRAGPRRCCCRRRRPRSVSGSVPRSCAGEISAASDVDALRPPAPGADDGGGPILFLANLERSEGDLHAARRLRRDRGGPRGSTSRDRRGRPEDAEAPTVAASPHARRIDLLGRVAREDVPWVLQACGVHRLPSGSRSASAPCRRWPAGAPSSPRTPAACASSLTPRVAAESPPATRPPSAGAARRADLARAARRDGRSQPPARRGTLRLGARGGPTGGRLRRGDRAVLDRGRRHAAEAVGPGGQLYEGVDDRSGGPTRGGARVMRTRSKRCAAVLSSRPASRAPRRHPRTPGHRSAGLPGVVPATPAIAAAERPALTAATLARRGGSYRLTLRFARSPRDAAAGIRASSGRPAAGCRRG